MNIASEEIRSEWRGLTGAIENAGTSWNDEVFGAFCARFMNPWSEQLPGLLRELERLEAEIRNAERVLS
jgi:hypothetical protein